MADDPAASIKEIAEKCGMDMPGMMAEAPTPYGGAQSFADLQNWAEAQAQATEISELTVQFRLLAQNIMDDDMMSIAEKAAAVTALGNEFQQQVQGLEVEDEDIEEAIEGKAQRGLLGRLLRGKATDPNVGGGVDRSKIPSRDFAGKNRSFPIVTPKDVSDAAQSIGRAGPGNYSAAQLKANITSIARRKGPSFVAALPKAWNVKDDGDVVTVFKDAEDGGSLTVFKDADGHYRWLSVYSNNFYDRDGEVFTEAAHKEYIDWIERTGRYPELWLWHTPGSKVGKADLLDYAEGLAIASGTFDPDQQAVALQLSQDKSLGISHGYRYEAKDLGADGDYRRYRTFEISPLPLERAANEGTLFLSEKEEMTMELTKEKRAFLVAKLGDERVKGIEANLGTLSKELKESGVGWKDFSESVAETPPAATAAEASSSTVRDEAEAGTGGALPNQEQAANALRELITSAVSSAIAPLEQRLEPLEASIKELKTSDDEKVARMFESRQRPTGQRPTETNQALRSDNAAVKEASEAMKEAEQAGGDPNDPLAWYKNAFTFGATVGQQQPTPVAGAGS